MDNNHQKSKKLKEILKIALILIVVFSVTYFSSKAVRNYINKDKYIEEQKIDYEFVEPFPMEPESLYCFFNKTTINDAVPRYECGILKVVTDDLDVLVNMENSTTFVVCNQSRDNFPACEGETYNFLRFPLDDFCVEQNCTVKGYVCGAYYVTYFNESESRELYEAVLFVKAGITEKEMLEDLDGCEMYG